MFQLFYRFTVIWIAASNVICDVTHLSMPMTIECEQSLRVQQQDSEEKGQGSPNAHPPLLIAWVSIFLTDCL